MDYFLDVESAHRLFYSQGAQGKKFWHYLRLTILMVQLRYIGSVNGQSL